MRSPKRSIIEQIHSIVDSTNRYVDCAVRIRVYRRDHNGDPQPAELTKLSYGGVYDTSTARYTGERPQKYTDLSIHPGQLQALEHIGGPKRRVLLLGAPGGGKTMAVVVVGIILAVRRANSFIGIVAPTRGRLTIVWRKFLETLEPSGFVKSYSPGKMDIHLVNGSTLQFRAAAKRSSGIGSPLAGHDWHYAVEDEQQDIDNDSLREVDARGRINKNYQVFSSATNEAKHEFQMRLLEYEANPSATVLRFSGPDNAFTPLAHWEALRANWNEEDYNRYIRCLDIPKKGRVYPQYATKESIGPLPQLRDITGELLDQKYHGQYKYLVGWDPGSTTSASVILKAFQAPGNERFWFVLDEITTLDASTEWHAKDLASWFAKRNIPLESVLVLGDPHENKDTDRSDFIAMRQAGFTCKPSNSGAPIERKHRISMVNALLQDATKKRRLFLVTGPTGKPVAEKLAECLGHLMYTPTGEIDFKHKTYQNLAHWGDALGYALFPFERMRGTYTPTQDKQEDRKPWRPINNGIGTSRR